MILFRIASKIASYKKVSLKTLLNEVKTNCPDDLEYEIGKFLGKGNFGEVYEVQGESSVIKIGMVRSESEIHKILNNLQDMQRRGAGILPEILDYGSLCEVDFGGPKWTFYYVIEKLYPISEKMVNLFNEVLTSREIDDRMKRLKLNIERKISPKGERPGRDLYMEKYSLEDLEKVLNLYEKMKKYGVHQRDMHGGNVMQNSEGDLKIIDLESIRTS